jgi:hypothetical protein
MLTVQSHWDSDKQSSTKPLLRRAISFYRKTSQAEGLKAFLKPNPTEMELRFCLSPTQLLRGLRPLNSLRLLKAERAGLFAALMNPVSHLENETNHYAAFFLFLKERIIRCAYDPCSPILRMK